MPRGGHSHRLRYGAQVPVPEFILRLRKRIGHDLLWLPGVTAVVLRGDEVLLVRRSDNGQWAPVTGIVDPGEHPAACASREVLEETGVVASVEALTWVNVSRPVVHANGDHAQYLDHTFKCRYISGKPHVADDESVEVGWFPTKALPNMAPGLVERIATVLRYQGEVRLTD